MRNRFAKLLTDVMNLHEELLNEQKEACAEVQRERDDVEKLLNEQEDACVELKDTCSDLQDKIREFEEKKTGD